MVCLYCISGIISRWTSFVAACSIPFSNESYHIAKGQGNNVLSNELRFEHRDSLSK